MESLIASLIILSVWLALSVVVGNIADRRGRNGMVWFFFSLAFSPLIGFFVVECLRPGGQPLPSTEPYETCPNCNKMVSKDADICEYCHTALKIQKSRKMAA